MKKKLEFFFKNIDTTCMKKILLVISLFLMTTIASFAQFANINWNSNLDFALKLAKTQNRPIVVFFMDEPAGTLSRTVLNNTLGNNVITEKISNNFVPLKIQGDTVLERQYDIQKIPSLLVLDSNGVEMDRLQGVIGIDQTFGLLENAQKNFENTSSRSGSTIYSMASDDSDIVKILSYTNGTGSFIKKSGDVWIHQTSFYTVEYRQYNEDKIHYYMVNADRNVLIAVPKIGNAKVWRYDLDEKKWKVASEVIDSESDR